MELIFNPIDLLSQSWVMPQGLRDRTCGRLGDQICPLSPPNPLDKFLLNNIFVCLLTYKRYNTYQTGFSFIRLGHAQVVGLGGAWGLKSVCLSVKISPPNPLDKIQPNLVCQLLT